MVIDDYHTLKTEEDIIDFVLKKLFEQGGPSHMNVGETFSPQCAYRGDEGKKCAVGHLIPDDCYAEFPIEKKLVPSLVDVYRNSVNWSSLGNWMTQHLKTLRMLQKFHDLYVGDIFTCYSDLTFDEFRKLFDHLSIRKLFDHLPKGSLAGTTFNKIIGRD